MKEYFAIFTISGLLYANSLFCGFVFDDISAIVNNKDIEIGSPWSDLLCNDFWGTPMSEEGSHKSYRPITVLTFKLNNLMSGKSPAPYHLVNIILHSTVCLLYYKATRTICRTAGIHSLRMQRKLPVTDDDGVGIDNFLKYVPGIATTLFMVHPIHCESVAGVVGRAELLSAMFMLLVFIYYSRFTVISMCCSVVFLLCAGLSKEQGVTVTAICAVYDMFISDKLTPLEVVSFRRTSNVVTGLRVCILAFAACLIILCRIALMDSDIPVFSLFDNPASFSPTPSRQLTFNFLLAQNLWLLLCPSSLLCDWTFGTVPIVSDISDFRNFATLVFYIFLLTLSYYAASKRNATSKVLIMGLAFLVFPFLPASNLLFSVGFVIAERVLYAPSMGYCLIVAIGLSKLATKYRRLKKPFGALFVFVLFCFSLKTVGRNADWMSDDTLFQSGLKVTTQNPKIWNNIGHTLEHDHPEKALVYYSEAARIQPNDIGSLINVGRINRRLGFFDEAEIVYRKALNLFPKHRKEGKIVARVAPEHLQVFVHLGNLVKRNESRLSEVDDLYKQALRYRRDFTDAHINRGEILILMGKLKEAIECYETALLYSKGNADVHFNLAVVHSQIGNLSGAIEHYTYAIQANPNHIRALYNSAVIFEETGDKELVRRAKVRVKRVLELEPDNHLALSLMGSIHLDEGNEKLAVSNWGKVLRIHPGDKSALYNMAQMYSKKADATSKAIETIETLLDHHPNYVKGLMLYGDMLLNQRKDYKAASDAFNKIIDADPSHVQARHNYCVVILQEGKLTEAEQCMEKVLSIAPDASFVINNLAIIRKHIAKRTAQSQNAVKFTSEDGGNTAEKLEVKSASRQEDDEAVFVEPARKKPAFSKRAAAILEDTKSTVANLESRNSQDRLQDIEKALRKVKSSVKKLTSMSEQVSNVMDEKCPSKKIDVKESGEDAPRPDRVDGLRRKALKALEDLEASLD